MTFWTSWVRHPQSLPVRKALFRIHRWTGVGAGLYIFLMSATGSLIVYRDELSAAFARAPVIVASQGTRMSLEQIKQTAQGRHPEYQLTKAYEPKNPNQAVEITFEGHGSLLDRLYNPFTGEDLGNRLRPEFRALLWLVDLHDNLLSGQTGRFVNGVGGMLLTTLALTGSVIWWPGVQNVRHSLSLAWSTRSPRFLWSLHSLLGFWFFLFVLTWGVSGIYLCFPKLFYGVLDFVDPYVPASRVPREGDIALFWLSRLHFGRFAGVLTKAVWTAVGIVPATLFATGGLLWWNRVLRTRLLRWKRGGRPSAT